MRPDWWRVAPEWKGETAAIIGGGPSLTAKQVRAAFWAGWRVIVINDGYRLAPDADILYFCDRKWWDGAGVAEFAGGHCADVLERFTGRIVTLENLWFTDPRILHLRNYTHCEREVGPIWTEPPDGVIGGHNGGYQAINLAVLLGVRRIILLGYDMKVAADRSHWFGDHPLPNDPTSYARNMIPAFNRAAPRLAELGVEVLNATPGSALDCFEKVDLESLLPDSERPALSPRSVL